MWVSPTVSRAIRVRRLGGLTIAISLVGAACTSTIGSVELGANQVDDRLSVTTESSEHLSSSPQGSTERPGITTTAPDSTAVPSTQISTTTPTTTTIAPIAVSLEPSELSDVFDPNCVVRTVAAASFEQVALDVRVADPVSLWQENGYVDALAAGDLVDVCAGNARNDIDGGDLPQPDLAVLAAALTGNVERQQIKLNEIFAGFGLVDLDVDGVSGPRTGQRLCAARLALGLATSTSDMQPGSNEQSLLFDAQSLPTPRSTAVRSERWVLIDRTCQMMFVGAGNETTFVFPTSTGSAGFETRDQDRAEAFRFNPALDNGGWHDSSEFPVGVDNPLNGNLYKPLYFDLGQAIHGANNVPATPESKGCARLTVGNQDLFVAWLGLDDAIGETWRREEMNVTVNVQGEYRSRDNDSGLREAVGG